VPRVVANATLPNGDQRIVLLIRNPSVPLPTVAPSPAQALHSRTTPAALALARCAVLRAAVTAKLAVCRWKQ
jgi:hypothetical protein